MPTYADIAEPDAQAIALGAPASSMMEEASKMPFQHTHMELLLMLRAYICVHAMLLRFRDMSILSFHTPFQPRIKERRRAQLLRQSIVLTFKSMRASLFIPKR